MKALQIGILAAVAAVGGALLMKWYAPRPQPQPAAVSTPAPAPAAASSEAQPPAAAPPSPFVEEPNKAQVPEEKRRPSPGKKPATTVARSQSPAVPQPPAPDTGPQTPPAPPAVEPPPAAPAPPPPPPPPRQVTLTAGTLIPVRLVEGLSSDRNQPGDTFTGTLESPMVVDGLAIAERGARVEGRVVQSQKAGRVKGVSDLAIELTHLKTSDGQRVELQTEAFEKRGETSVGSDAAKVGAAAGIGAAIGAIAGGGKGAGIGAAIGGAAGTGGVMATRGKPAVLPSETKINFRLKNPVTITERRPKA
jgi:hypothetical protein